MHRARTCRTRDRGQAAVVVVVAAAVWLAVVAAAVVHTGGRIVDRSRAQSAADAAALGSLAGGRPTAVELAERHGAVLVSWSAAGDEVTVVVRVGGVTATARATDAP